MPSSSGSEERAFVVQSRLVHLSQGLVALIATGVPVFIFAAAVGGGWGLGFLGVGALLSVVAVQRAFRTKLVLDDAGVTVINYWRTYRMPWDQIGDVWDGVNTVGAGVVPAIAFACRGRRGPVAAQATSGSARDRRRVFEHIRPYADKWSIRVHD